MRHRETVRELAREIDSAISGFVRGQLVVCLLLGLYYAIALTLVGLHFGVADRPRRRPDHLRALCRLADRPPVASAVALAQFWPDWQWIVAVVVDLPGRPVRRGQHPRAQAGRRARRPASGLADFALFAFGYLFGFVGLLLAVPLAAAIGVLFRFGLRRYLASPIYTGGQPS